jgi:D-alanyl-D-alanine carboxypeptidase (penicillin-binding protein 5/6)
LWIALGILLAGKLSAQEPPEPAPPRLEAAGYVLLDFATGDVLVEENADTRLQPASLTKLMTAYAVFSALDAGLIARDDPVYVSERAWRMRGSRMFIEVDTHVSVAELLQGLIVQSGNDASVALAEHVAGSEESFVELMNAYAAKLGMSNTSYRNSMGLPAKDHYSTARDSAVLARALIAEFPHYYDLYSQREFSYNDIWQRNRNALLWQDESVDGLKTGYTRDAGYCLVSSAERAGMRLIAAVLGMNSAKARTEGSQALLDFGFEAFETHKLYGRGEPVIEARVWKGSPEMVEFGPTEDVYVTIPRGAYSALSASLQLSSNLKAPLPADREVGEVTVSFRGHDLFSEPLVALHAVPEAGLWTRFKDGLMLWFEDD